MTWDEILDLLGYDTISVVKTKDHVAEYSGAAALPPHVKAPCTDIVWFASLNAYRQLPEDARDGRAFILRSGKPVLYENLPSGNLAVLADPEDLQPCLDALLSEFAALHRIRQGILELIALVTGNVGLSRIANKIAEIYGTPVSIIDNAFAFIAASDNYAELPAANFRNELDAGYVEYEAQEFLRASELLYPKKKRTATVYFDYGLRDGSSIRNYLTLIYIQNIHVASFSLMTPTGTAISAGRANLLPIIAQLISVELQKSDFYLTNKATYYEHLLTQLLDNTHPIDNKMFGKRLSLFGYTLERYKYVVYVDFRDEDFDIRRIRSFAGRFRTNIPNSLYFIHERNILYLTSRANDPAIPDTEIAAWQRIIASTGIRIGVSSMFENIAQMQTHLKQARSVIDTGRRFPDAGAICSFDAYRLADMVVHMPEDMDYYYYCYPPLRRLIDRDEQNDTNLTNTLYKYLENPTRPAEVCKELFIHKNTLYYRLDKIREIMQTDFKTADVIAQLHLTFQILKYKNLFSTLVERKSE
jgi:sugar diacid utilization regulator